MATWLLNRDGVDYCTAVVEKCNLIPSLDRKRISIREGADDLSPVGVYGLRLAPDGYRLSRVQRHPTIDLHAAAGLVDLAGSGVLCLQGEARQVGHLIALVYHRNVLYAAPALGELDPVKDDLGITRFPPDVRTRQIEERLREDAAIDVPLKQILDDVPVAARREHRDERCVSDLELGGERTILAPSEFLTRLRVAGLGDVVGKELDLRVIGAQLVQGPVDLVVGLHALRILDPSRRI